MKRFPRANLSSHGRGRGFESPIAHSEEPLISGGFFACSLGNVGELGCAHGRGHSAYGLQTLHISAQAGTGVERTVGSLAPRRRSDRAVMVDAAAATVKMRGQAAPAVGAVSNTVFMEGAQVMASWPRAWR